MCKRACASAVHVGRYNTVERNLSSYLHFYGAYVPKQITLTALAILQTLNGHPTKFNLKANLLITGRIPLVWGNPMFGLKNASYNSKPAL